MKDGFRFGMNREENTANREELVMVRRATQH